MGGEYWTQKNVVETFYYSQELKGDKERAAKSDDILLGEVKLTKNFESAKVIFNTLKKARIRYQSDPNIPYYKDLILFHYK